MYEVVGTEKKFVDIFKLLDFYESNSLSHHIDGIGEEILSEAAVLKKASGNYCQHMQVCPWP